MIFILVTTVTTAGFDPYPGKQQKQDHNSNRSNFKHENKFGIVLQLSIQN
jgi:hypothetical protein